ncbi:MAG: HAD-IA family hydrolase [Desulfobacterales bacterium]|jgi:HAD superfamily hydrolase (TIGR01549 family)
MINRPFYIKAVLFDFDGTLTKPGALNFPRLKEAIGCPADDPILEFIEDLPTLSQRNESLKQLDRFEKEAAINSEPNIGAQKLIHFLRSKKIGIGIITRNTLSSVKRALKNFEDIDMSYFDVIVSRETPTRLKPSGDGIILAAETLNVDVKQILMVGDFVFDIQAGQTAGCMTVFLDYGTVSGATKIESDFTVSNLEEIKDIVRLGLPLLSGKLPNDLLENFLDGFDFHDPSVLINAGVGEDAAAVDVEKEEVLVIKSDPITFATDAIGHYAVLINANDIATSGAIPRWFLTTMLFPPGVTASFIRQVMHELESVCRRWSITLCGGHTEITDAVTRPVITGMLAGTVTKNRLIDKRNITPGDNVLLTKALAVEGTAIIAREFSDRLGVLGMTESDIETCKQLLFSISILEEAQIACNCGGVSAMHDITEGGLATALMELSIAGEHRIRVNMDRIPIFEQTQKMCHLLGIDPMGLIGSGSLLICSRKHETATMMDRIRDAGIDIARIGEVMEAGRGVEAVSNGGPAVWPSFEVDEITRLY